MSRPNVRLFITPWFVYGLAYLCMMMLHAYLNVLSVIIMQYRLEILSQSKPGSNQGLLSPCPNKPEEDENVHGTSLSLRYRHVPQVNCSDLPSSLGVDGQQSSINHPTNYPITGLQPGRLGCFASHCKGPVTCPCKCKKLQWKKGWMRWFIIIISCLQLFCRWKEMNYSSKSCLLLRHAAMRRIVDHPLVKCHRISRLLSTEHGNVENPYWKVPSGNDTGITIYNTFTRSKVPLKLSTEGNLKWYDFSCPKRSKSRLCYS